MNTTGYGLALLRTAVLAALCDNLLGFLGTPLRCWGTAASTTSSLGAGIVCGAHLDALDLMRHPRRRRSGFVGVDRSRPLPGLVPSFSIVNCILVLSYSYDLNRLSYLFSNSLLSVLRLFCHCVFVCP